MNAPTPAEARPLLHSCAAVRQSLQNDKPGPRLFRRRRRTERSDHRPLTRLRGSFVIARNTAFTFKGKNVDARQEIGKEAWRSLRARRLCAARGGAHAGQCPTPSTRRPAITFGLTALISLPRISSRMQDGDRCPPRQSVGGAELIAAEARRAQQAPNPDSMDLYFQGLAWLNRGINPEKNHGAGLARLIF